MIAIHVIPHRLTSATSPHAILFSFFLILCKCQSNRAGRFALKQNIEIGKLLNIRRGSRLTHILWHLTFTFERSSCVASWSHRVSIALELFVEVLFGKRIFRGIF